MAGISLSKALWPIEVFIANIFCADSRSSAQVWSTLPPSEVSRHLLAMRESGNFTRPLFSG